MPLTQPDDRRYLVHITDGNSRRIVAVTAPRAIDAEVRVLKEAGAAWHCTRSEERDA